MTNTPPKLDGVEAEFQHVDEFDWTPVQRQRNADGSVSVVREKWPIFRPEFLSAYVHYEPAMVVRRHGHRSNHVVFVLDGGAWIGGDWCTAGTHIHVPLGAAFGPIVAGPDGVTCWELSFGEFGGWGDQPELYEQAIAALGASPLPDPPLVNLPEWFVDPRGDWGGERPSPKIDGLSETITRVDDIAWAEVPPHPNANGATAATRTKSLIDEPAFTSIYVEYEPGASVRPHGYFGHHLAWVIAGGAWFGQRWCPAGTHIELPVGVAFEAITAGADGARMLHLTNGPAGWWEDEPEGSARD